MALRAKITTVTAAATDRDLTDLDTIKSELDLGNTTAYDKFLARQITWASAAAENFCNRVFVTETLTDQFWPLRDEFPSLQNGIEPFQLSRFPVISIASVQERAGTDSATMLVSGTDYLPDLDNGILIRLDSSLQPKIWPAVALSASYVAGFATIPADVVDAVIRLVKTRWFARKRDPMLRSEQIDGVRSVEYWVQTGTDAGAMPPEVQDLLNNYRIPVVR